MPYGVSDGVATVIAVILERKISMVERGSRYGKNVVRVKLFHNMCNFILLFWKKCALLTFH